MKKVILLVLIGLFIVSCESSCNVEFTTSKQQEKRVKFITRQDDINLFEVDGHHYIAL